MWPGHPSPLNGRWTVTGELDPVSQANIIRDRKSQQVGLYFDDSMPNLRSWLAKALAEPDPGRIFVAVPMGQNPTYPKPVIALKEWYPYNTGWGTYKPRMPRSAGFILQRAYPGYEHETFPGKPLTAPTRWQFLRLRIQARLHGARYVWAF